MSTTLALAIGAVALIGPLTGMSLDQSVKQLPARRQIGIAAFSAYSRAADLVNGVYLYAFFGVGAALLAIAAAISAYAGGGTHSSQLPLTLSATLAVLHSLVTARAAPINFRQRHFALTDEAQLAPVLDAFARWNAIRAALQVANFAAAVWAIVGLASHSS
jgi:hypothetical protein